MSKQSVDTIFVIASCAMPDVIKDQVEAIRWGCNRSNFIVVVDDGGHLGDFQHKHVKILIACGKIHHASKVGFKVNEGIAWALDNFDFKMVAVLDDDALVIGRGLDSWAVSVLESNPAIGLLGVKDDVRACEIYSREDNQVKCLNCLREWISIPEHFEYPLENIFYAVNFQPYSIVAKLKDLNLLSSECETWPMPCESFQTVVTKLLGYELSFCGQYPNNLEPPLYAMHHGSVKPPDPRGLPESYLIHHSIRQVPNVNESELRNHYRNIRRRTSICLL